MTPHYITCPCCHGIGLARWLPVACETCDGEGTIAYPLDDRLDPERVTVAIMARLVALPKMMEATNDN